LRTRIAYLILAHKNPDQLGRLARALATDRARFVVHVDKRSGDAMYASAQQVLGEVGGVCFVERERCYWGDFSLVRATLKALDAALSLTPQPDYVVLLSGQDYPIKPTAAIERFFERHRHSAFMRHFPLPYEPWPAGGFNRIERWHVRVGRRHLGLPFRRRFPKGYEPYGGSQFWSLPREAAAYVLEFAQRGTSFVRFFEHVYIPDELFFPTLLLNSPFRAHVMNDNLRHIEWSPAQDGGGPRIWRAEDFDKLAASKKRFARKFDTTVDDGILELVDRMLSA
jgi:hypothetical protein